MSSQASYVACSVGKTGFCLCLDNSGVITITVLISVGFFSSLLFFYYYANVKIPVESEDVEENRSFKNVLYQRLPLLAKYEKIICLLGFYIGIPYIGKLFFFIKSKIYSYFIVNILLRLDNRFGIPNFK